MAKAKKKKKSTKKGQNKLAIVIAVLLIGAFISRYITPAESPATAQYSEELTTALTGKGVKSQIVKHTGYTLSYNNDTRNANWVGYELTDEEVQGVVERGNNFCPDPLVVGTQAVDDDYRNSGWDRGHLAPAADMKWSKKAMEESFYLSNVSPQNKKLNRGTWKKLEELCRDKAELYGRIIVVTGPIFYSEKPQTIGKNEVKVPDAFFKVLLSDYHGTYRTIGFVCENKAGKKSLKECARSVDDIEKATNIDFFSQLPDSIENNVEKSYSTAFWGI